jgi:predicted lipoprotein with Yx(FWY)xxD motif
MADRQLLIADIDRSLIAIEGAHKLAMAQMQFAQSALRQLQKQMDDIRAALAEKLDT